MSKQMISLRMSTQMIPSPLSMTHQLAVQGILNAVAWTPNSSFLVSLSDFGSRITLIDSNSGVVVSELTRLGGGYSRNSIAVLSHGGVLTPTPKGVFPLSKYADSIKLIGTKVKSVQQLALIEWNLTSKAVEKYFPAPEAVINSAGTRPLSGDVFTASQDGSLVASVGGKAEDDILVFDATSARIIATFHLDQVVKQHSRSLAFSPDSTMIAIGTSKGNVYIYNISDERMVHHFMVYPRGEFSCSVITFSPNGQLVATGRSKNLYSSNEKCAAADIWSLTDRNFHQSLVDTDSSQANQSTTTPTFSLAWGRDGRHIATGDGLSLKVWEVGIRSSRPIQNISFEAPVYSLAYSKDNRLAVGSGSTVYLYNWKE